MLFSKRDKGEAQAESWNENEHPADGQVYREDVVAMAAQYTPGSPEEKALLKKIDYRIVPCVWALVSHSLHIA